MSAEKRPFVPITRRVFIETLGLTSIGLYFGLYSLAEQLTSQPSGKMGAKPKTGSKEQEESAAGLNPNVFLHIAPDGQVTLVCHRSEMGQGIRSTLPVL